MTTIAQKHLDRGPSEPLVGPYCVSVYPPLSAWHSQDIPALQTALQKRSTHDELALYIHIPFCQKKCDFCFHLAHTGEARGVVNRYLTALVDELKLYLAHPALRRRKITCIYFSGGTPSTLTPTQMDYLNCELRSLIKGKAIKEITFECAPRSVRPELLRALKSFGVTRISLGVQSFDSVLLKTNGRIHLSDDVYQAYNRIRNAGFKNVNLDLMTGLVGETPEQWRDTVHAAIKMSPESVTIYQTEITNDTAVYRDLKAGCIIPPIPSWDTKRARLLYGLSELERADYTVTSAYCAVKDPHLHEFQYNDHLWRGGDVIGLGAGSLGYFNGVQYKNKEALDAYVTSVTNNALPVKQAYPLGDFDQLVREFVLQLKFGEVDACYFKSKYGVELSDLFADTLEDLTADGFLIFFQIRYSAHPRRTVAR